VLTHLGAMLAVAVVLGVVVAGLAIPFAGVAGINARNVARTMDDLPKELETGALPERTRILDKDGDLVTTLYDENRVTRPLSQISRVMIQAMVAIEDYRFYQHGALDLKGTLRAFITNQANAGVVQGGSSITQQLVKMTLVNNADSEEERKAATDDSYARKLRELRYAIAMEENQSKDWILERYLNTAYFGDGAHGIQAAARHYFSVNADKLSLPQAAMLAGLVKNPTGYDPTNSPDRALERRNIVLDRMAQLNVITREEANAAKDTDLGLKVTRSKNGCVNATAPFFCDYVVQWLLKDPALGATPEERMTKLKSGGFTIRTTLDLPAQKAADAAVSEHVYPTDKAIGALAVVEPGTGNVMAVAQSRPMGRKKKQGETYLNYIVPEQYGDSRGFQAGSTFKAFTLAAAVSQGVALNTAIQAPEERTFNLSEFSNCEGARPFAGTWKVGNSTTSGVKDLYSGTRESVNTFYVELIRRTGVCDPFNLGVSMGLQLDKPDGDARGNGMERTPAFTLGIVDVSPLEMAEAYATFGARGKHCDSRPVLEIEDAAGNTLKNYEESCNQVMPAATADAVNDVLRGVQEPGGFGYDLGGTGLTNADGVRIPSAGKTGTTQEGKSVWYVGYTPQVATAAMIAGANDEGQPVGIPGQTIGGVYRPSASGSGFAGPMWADVMHEIDDRLEPIEFVKPDPTVVRGVMADVPSISGLSLDAAKARLRAAGFGASEGGWVNSSVSRGTVAYGFPSSEATLGSVITIYMSLGPEPQPQPKKKRRDRGGADGGGNNRDMVQRDSGGSGNEGPGNRNGDRRGDN
jgi:membrane peptidoglycan carboxypeptidase